MQWVNIRGAADAYRFDLLIAQMQIALLQGAAGFQDLKDAALNQVADLQSNLAQVRDRAEVIRRFRSAAFWRDVTVEALEAVRQDLRGIMQYRDKGGSAGPTPPRVIDVKDTEAVRAHRLTQIGRASCRERVCQYV